MMGLVQVSVNHLSLYTAFWLTGNWPGEDAESEKAVEWNKKNLDKKDRLDRWIKNPYFPARNCL